MRWFCLSLLSLVLSLAAIIPASWPAAAQDKPQSTLGPLMLAAQDELRQKFNVPALVWDAGLAALAQGWANKIAASGAVPPAHRASGENMLWGTADQWQPKDIVEMWENESKNYDRATNTCVAGKSCVHSTRACS